MSRHVTKSRKESLHDEIAPASLHDDAAVMNISNQFQNAEWVDSFGMFCFSNDHSAVQHTFYWLGQHMSDIFSKGGECIRLSGEYP